MAEPAWKQKARERVKQRREGSTFKLQEGENCVRVHQHKKGPNHPPFLEYKKHFNVGPDKRQMTCGHDIDGGGSCWGCDTKIPELEKSESKGKRKMAEDIAAQDQFLVLASRIDEDTKKWSLGKPWYVPNSSGKSLSVTLQGMFASSKRTIEDPVKGYNLNIERTGTGMATRYGAVIPDEKPSKVPQAVLDALKPIESYIEPYDEEKFKAAYYGRPEEDVDEEDEGVAPDEETTEETSETETEETEESEVEEEPEVEESESEEEPPLDDEVPEEYEPEEESEVEEEPEVEEEEAPPPRKPAPKPTGKHAPKPPPKAPAKPAPKPPAKKK